MNKVIEAITQILEAAVANASSPLYYHASSSPTGVRSVYFGDPIQIPESNHPALVVHPVSTDYVKRGSRYDQKVITVEVKLVDNVKHYLATTPSDSQRVSSVERFGNMIEKVDTSQKTNVLSVCGLIQNNPKLPYTDPDTAAAATASQDAQVRRVDYVFNSARGYPTFEAIVLIDVVTQGDRS